MLRGRPYNKPVCNRTAAHLNLLAAVSKVRRIKPYRTAINAGRLGSFGTLKRHKRSDARIEGGTKHSGIGTVRLARAQKETAAASLEQTCFLAIVQRIELWFQFRWLERGQA